MLRQRWTSGLLMFGVVLATLVWLPSAFDALLLLIVALLGQMEFYAILDGAGIPAFRVLGNVAGSALIASTYLTLTSAAIPPASRVAVSFDVGLLVLVLTVFGVCLRQFPQKNTPQPLPTIGCTLFGFFYVPFLLNFITRLLLTWDFVRWTQPLQHTGVALCLYLIVVVKTGDIGAFFIGTAAGRHKLLPRISPGKTWEGVVGGLCASVLASLICLHVLGGSVRSGRPAVLGPLTLGTGDAVVLGLLLGGLGIVGDLVESLLKRAAGAKDSGRTVPGMGGVLDVLDSLLFATPALYYYARAFMGPA
jgi:phosphatidate cytidylyltransferase